MENKEIIKKDLLAARKTVLKLEHKLNVLVEVDELPKLQKLFKGKFFKQRNNYSCPEKRSDYWWVYSYVSDVTGLRTGKGFAFQKCKYGKVTIETQEDIYLDHVGKSIGKKEFMTAYKKLLKSLPAVLSAQINLATN